MSLKENERIEISKTNELKTELKELEPKLKSELKSKESIFKKLGLNYELTF